MVQIVVNGVFCEDFKETNYRHVFRSFCRTFSIVPVGGGWSILGDMFFLTTVNDELLLESTKRFYVFRKLAVTKKKSNNDNNSNNTGIMFMEDTEEMAGMESSYQQSPTPNYPPPSYQQSTFSSYQSSPMTNPQPPPAYQGGGTQASNPQVQQQIVPAATTVSFQPDTLQQSASSFPMFNAVPASTTEFPTSSTPVPLAVNQSSTKVPVNVISDVNANPDKLTLVKNFSTESGMNNEWAKK